MKLVLRAISYFTGKFCLVCNNFHTKLGFEKCIINPKAKPGENSQDRVVSKLDLNGI